MKIIVTGHTKGLGKAFYEHYVNLGHDVIGFSRSNGFDVDDKDAVTKIINAAKESNIFFNNVHSGLSQVDFLHRLHNATTIITSGSMAADLRGLNEYAKEKLILENTHKQLAKTTSCPMLFLKMGYLENYNDKPFRVIKYKEVIDYIDFWLVNRKATLIEFDNNNL
jgi:hypothetical protein